MSLTRFFFPSRKHIKFFLFLWKLFMFFHFRSWASGLFPKGERKRSVLLFFFPLIQSDENISAGDRFKYKRKRCRGAVVVLNIKWPVLRDNEKLLEKCQRHGQFDRKCDKGEISYEKTKVTRKSLFRLMFF